MSSVCNAESGIGRERLPARWNDSLTCVIATFMAALRQRYAAAPEQGRRKLAIAYRSAARREHPPLSCTGPRAI